MARYVLLAFDKDSDADAFVKNVQENNGAALVEGYDHGIIQAFVRGMWQKPTIFCQCTQIKGRGWTRGKKRGWWVCTKCARPSMGWARGDVWYTALGTNMMPIANNAPEYRGPMHKQHPGYSGPPVPSEVT
jgi:hypothetical protein